MSLCTLNLAVSAQPPSPLRSAVSRSSLIVYKKKGLFLSSTRKTENIAVNITDGSTPQYNAKRKNRESGWRPSCPFLYRGYTRDAAIRPNKPGSPNFVQLTTMPSDQSPARVDLQTRRCAARFPCYLSDLEGSIIQSESEPPACHRSLFVRGSLRLGRDDLERGGRTIQSHRLDLGIGRQGVSDG